MKIYLAGPMRGIPQFNFPAFMEAAKFLREQGNEVFNPAERDEQTYGKETSNSATGNLDDVKACGFNLREALGADLAWICAEADAIALLPNWDNSKGVRAELATANALGLQVTYLIALEEGGYHWLK